MLRTHLIHLNFPLINPKYLKNLLNYLIVVKDLSNHQRVLIPQKKNLRNGVLDILDQVNNLKTYT